MLKLQDYLAIQWLSICVLIVLNSVLSHGSPGAIMVPFAVLAISATCLWWILRFTAWCYTYMSVRLKPEQVSQRVILKPAGKVYLDPAHGMMLQATHPETGQALEILLEPEWWRFVPSTSRVNMNEKDETAVLGSTYSVVDPGKEPKSLVLLKNGATTVGAGCRIKFMGKDYLLTAAHVWYRPQGICELCKGGRAIPIDPSWKVAYSCAQPPVDFVLVEVPSPVWSKLEVGCAKVSPWRSPIFATAFGGDNSLKLLSAHGKVDQEMGNGLRLTHFCATAQGFSGTPLYTENGVIGMHLGYKELGRSNRAFNVGACLQILQAHLTTDETTMPVIGFRELDDISDREGDYDTYLIEPLGELKVRNKEFIWLEKWEERQRAAGRDLWHEAEDEMDDADYEKLLREVKGYSLATNETVLDSEPLNFLKDGERPLPPFELSGSTDSSKVQQKSQKKECLSSELESRVSSLEKLLEKSLQQTLSMQAQFSQSLANLAGQIEGLQQSARRSSSKLEDSKSPPVQRASKKHVKPSSSSTPAQPSSPVLEAKSGIGKQSSQQPRRRRSRRKSTSQPAPASLVQPLAARTTPS
ncbi:P2a [Mimosa mosaic virus]|uniref:P2a n=1 Tax=Mimosa mosaic virus TaxID=3018030 RepID=A0AA95EDC0_9VIRU|nr:P2a [Mimosa mosaic virus]